jgi:hypothetical protein
VRDVAEKAARRQIRRWGQNLGSVGECPHLSGAHGVGQVLQDGFEFELVLPLITAYIGGQLFNCY